MTRSFEYHTDRKTITRTILTLLFIIAGAVLLYVLYTGGAFSAWFLSAVLAVLALMILSIPRRVVLLDDTLEIQCVSDITEINIREITQKGLYYKDGKWIETEPLEIHQPLTYPNIGPRESYLLHHEELESLVKNYPTIKQARFWMTFGEQYLKHLDVIQNIGMSRIDEIEYEAPLADASGKTVKVKIVPLQFLKAVLPNPQDLGQNYEGETSIGCRIRGIKNGKERTYYVYNNCKHQAAYLETGMQGVSYTTGVPAMIGAMMFLKGLWRKSGVWNVEDFDPDPFMQQLNIQGLPWVEVFDGDLEL